MRPPAYEPGIYTREQIADYDAIPAINQSLLKYIGKSPLHFQHARTAVRKPTVPMRLGSIAHVAVLEPARVDLEYVAYVPEAGKKDTFKGKHYDAFVEAAVGREVVKARELEEAWRMAEAIRTNKLAARYLKAGQAEAILIWRDAITGLLCKARLDWLSHSVPDVMVELKTAADVAPWAFAGAFGKRGYHTQIAFYTDGYKAITGRELYSKCVAVENVEPHDVIVYDLAEVVDAGRDEYRALMAKLVEAQRTNSWHGQATTELTLELPKWLIDDDGENALSDLGLEGWDGDA